MSLNTGNDEAAAKLSQIRILKTSPQDHGRVIQTGKMSYSATEVHQNYEVSAQGGSEKTRFYTSFAYTKQEGITNVSGYERFTGRAM